MYHDKVKVKNKQLLLLMYDRLVATVPRGKTYLL